MTNNILNATMAGGIEIIPAGKTKLVLQINTTDRENLSTASWAITATGKSYAATADASGRAEILVDSGYTYTVTMTHDGQYENDAPQDVVARSTETTWVYFDLFYYPAMSNVVLATTVPVAEGVEITATCGALAPHTATTDSTGTAVFKGLAPGETWTFTTAGGATATLYVDQLVDLVDVPIAMVRVKSTPSTAVTATNGTRTETTTVDTEGAGYFADLPLGETWTFTGVVPISRTIRIGDITLDLTRMLYTMEFNPTTFMTDPMGCLVYADDCAGFTCVGPHQTSNVNSASVANGSWAFNADGTSDNRLLNGCFYATFKADGTLHQKLDPKNLRDVLAVWDDETRTWQDPGTATTSAINTENTMFCIPTLYFDSDATHIHLSNDPSRGAARAHVIDGHTYQYLGLGVYMATVSSRKVVSKSNTAVTRNLTRAEFRPLAQANTVIRGKAMLWNYYQWQLYRIMVLFAAKSFNSQTAIGDGGAKDGSSSSSNIQGYCNGETGRRGPFQGGKIGTSSTGMNATVKAYIENAWACYSQFIDDIVCVDNTLYAGQSSTPDDTVAGKTAIGSVVSGFGKIISTDPLSWGLSQDGGGSQTTALCDYQRRSNSDTGTFTGAVSGENSYQSGVSYLDVSDNLEFKSELYTTRLAYVFDLE